jgi:hypothetical protein
MQDWLRRHDQFAPDTSSWHGMRMDGMLTDEELAAMNAAKGVAFDRLFLVGMIKHHAGALKMVDDLFKSPGAGQEVDANVFANDVVWRRPPRSASCGACSRSSPQVTALPPTPHPRSLTSMRDAWPHPACSGPSSCRRCCRRRRTDQQGSPQPPQARSLRRRHGVQRHAAGVDGAEAGAVRHRAGSRSPTPTSRSARTTSTRPTSPASPSGTSRSGQARDGLGRASASPRRVTRPSTEPAVPVRRGRGQPQGLR